MSALTKGGAAAAIDVKKNFPDAGPLLSRKTSSVTTTYSAAAPYKHTDASGVSELTFTPTGTAAVGNGLLVCFSAPNDDVATDWLADTTADSDQLQYMFIAVGTTRTRTFDKPITRWDMVAVGASMTVYQEKAR